MTATCCASRPGRHSHGGPSRRRTPRGAAFALLAILLPLAGCGDDGSGTTAPPEVAQVVLEAPLTELELGDSTQLAARVLGASGEELTGRTAAWSSSNEAVLRVSQTGMVTGVGPGSATITATVEARSATVSLTRSPHRDPFPTAIPIVTAGRSSRRPARRASDPPSSARPGVLYTICRNEERHEFDHGCRPG